jgi:signal transduction histidine kinase/CheY-like chemotaxis protein
MSHIPIRRAVALALLVVAATASAQDRVPAAAGQAAEAGRPIIRNYAPADYSGGTQNWAMLQDMRGLLYVANSVGVLEFDGASWRTIRFPNRANARSLAMDDQGRIYVGGAGEFGYLAADAHGELQFVSLVDKLPADNRVFEDVWRIYVTPRGVYFQTQVGLFRWANEAMRIWKPKVRFNRASYLNGKLYLSEPGIGLMVMNGDTLELMPGTERLGNEVYPILLPYDERRVLVGTRSDGLFLYDGASLTPFATEVDALIKSSNLYRGFELPDGKLALTTTIGGVAIIDRAGHRLQVLNKETGLRDSSAYYAMTDRQGALWLGLASGLARVETLSPASFYAEADGLPPIGQSRLVRHQGHLYSATGAGVFVLQSKGAATAFPRFVRVSGIATQSWDLLEFADPANSQTPDLLAATSDGVFHIDGDKATVVVPSVSRSFNASSLLKSKSNGTRVWVGLFDGVASLRYVDGRWENEGRIAGITEQVRSLVESDGGVLWAGTQSSGLLRITFDPAALAGGVRPSPHVERFGVAEGLPSGQVVAYSAGGKPLFQAFKTALLRYDGASRAFVKDDTFNVIAPNPDGGFLGITEAPNGDVLVGNGIELAALRHQPNGGYQKNNVAFGRFWTGAEVFFDRDGVVWFASDTFLYRYDTMMRREDATPIPALIRKVTLNEKTVVFGGGADAPQPTLGPSSKALRFEFAAASFYDEKATVYRSRLDGLDGDWSGWTKESRRDYTNLGFGLYRFRLQARDVSGRETAEAVYAFIIQPPFYRTWWAYTLYALGLLAIGFGVDRLQRRRVISKERERATFNEARLRVESAEALAKSERERMKNVELLSEIGREITASLDIDTIFVKLYEHVNQLADADVFGVGLHHQDRFEIEFRLAIENGHRYAPYSRDTTNPNQFPVWCIAHREPVFINDVDQEYGKYLAQYDGQSRPLDDGSMSRQPQSLIYLPLISKERVLGVITIQSFEKHAYTEYHLNVMQNLAAYTAIALDNAAAYRQLNEQEHEIRRLFEEAERARAIAEEADAAKSAFLSTVSHELRTPLTSVLGFAKIIRKRLEERIFPLIQTDDRKIRQTMQQVEDNLKVVVSEGERLTKLIDDVLDLAKIEAGKLEWHSESVDLREVIGHATSATSSLLDQKGLTLVTEVAADLPTLTGDRDRLVQVVINLISNAVKFTDSGSVTCRAVSGNGEIVVSVADTGVGITPEDQPRVFERFKQVGDTLTDKPKGTGLGLPICREIVEHHGGRIWVDSEIGHGSTFSFSIPIAGTAPSVGTGPVELAALIRQLRDQVVVTTPRTPARQPRILVVDDEANIRELLTQEFSEAGYQVSVAANGREALVEVRRNRPDLVVLDVMMPEMNGFDVAAVLKNDPQTLDIPIVILSIVQDKDRGFRLGVDRYLTKPIDTELLFREVGALIEQKRSRKRVLVVDQDASTVKTLTDVLRSRGYTVTEARGDNLLEAAKALQPDIIMMNSVSSAKPEAVQLLRFEKGLENVLFLVYQ